jgi:hypothetical protein
VVGGHNLAVGGGSSWRKYLCVFRSAYTFCFIIYLFFALVPGYLNFAPYPNSSVSADTLLYVKAFSHIWKGVGQDRSSEEHSSSAQIF